ncbi:MAG: ribonuclease Y [candidate division KSB1 bacterium]|nr:ribonuclease Y [candidate division KSB1 bacterium]MDZ7294531.1 ribonuclease Y [candidate division KSB1 bacterium]MDZ7337493.1 ribonuclease Y [candidate division KSB1 bacterium]MDZ7392414.1 ribonuclease Y [candidate division KSB1 bacterium]MDZ7412259.1 ribonuclease Y [candidate division KSB1 bacterium]
MDVTTLIIAIGCAAVAFVAGWYASKRVGQGKIASAEKLAEKIVSEAEKTAEALRKEKLLEAKDEWLRMKQEFENETKSRRVELQNLERQLANRELNLDKRADLLNKKERDLEQLSQQLKEESAQVKKRQEELDRLIEEQNARLEKISGLSHEEAKKILMDNLLEKARQEAAQMVKEIKDQARQNANREAREIILQAIQRSAADHSVETTVSVVNLPNDEMKGRIIGREGRNIRAFEMATGIEIIVDDTPEAVILSGFDPLRREIARQALEKLIADGRIHPARIEEVVQKTAQEVEESLSQEGEKAMLETGVHGLHPELVKLLGKLHYRTSYGQNALQHAIEVSYLAGLMAAQLGLDANLAKRAGLLHDIGKAIDRYTEGTHTQIGVELAKKYGENPVVINAIAAHHEDVEITSPISILVQAADAISSSRPGARRESLESYVKRLEKLEEVAKSFSGVGRAYAIQAGREIRVMVEPEKVSDAMAEQLSSEIAQKIQAEMEYPGQIKVTVIREYRAVDYAK